MSDDLNYCEIGDDIKSVMLNSFVSSPKTTAPVIGKCER